MKTQKERRTEQNDDKRAARIQKLNALMHLKYPCQARGFDIERKEKKRREDRVHNNISMCKRKKMFSLVSTIRNICRYLYVCIACAKVVFIHLFYFHFLLLLLLHRLCCVRLRVLFGMQ